jgi:hypothetical protein
LLIISISRWRFAKSAASKEGAMIVLAMTDLVFCKGTNYMGFAIGTNQSNLNPYYSLLL